MTNPPAGLDYDLWLGPAPKRPFNPNRFHYNFRWFWDYAGGLMTDWGVHLINMALMGMGPEAPKTVCSSGGIYVQDDMRETPDSQLAVYEFPELPARVGTQERHGRWPQWPFVGRLLVGH